MYDISLRFQPEPNYKPSTNITFIPDMEVFFVMVPEVPSACCCRGCHVLVLAAGQCPFHRLPLPALT